MKLLNFHFDVVRSPHSEEWGNVFLTDSWTLYVDMRKLQHDVAMKELGIDRHSVLMSGCINEYGVGFRSSPGVDRKLITSDRAVELARAIRELLNKPSKWE